MPPISTSSNEIFNRETQLNLKAIITECGEKNKIFFRQGLHTSSGSSGKACLDDNDKRGRKFMPPKFARLNWGKKTKQKEREK